MPPMNFWQGKRVRLRAIEPSDARYFFEWNMDSDRARHLDFLWPPSSLAAVTAWCEEQSRRKLVDDAYHWLVENEAGEPVGSISTHDCRPHDGTFSYGLDIADEHRRKRYASEAVCLVLRYYFEELRYQKCTVVVHDNNEASVRLHEALGFQREGTVRRMVFSGGQYFDNIWFGITAEEFSRREWPV